MVENVQNSQISHGSNQRYQLTYFEKINFELTKTCFFFNNSSKINVNILK